MCDPAPPPYGTKEQFAQSMDALNRAVKFHDNKKSELAKAMGYTSMTVCNWFKRGIPLEQAKEIERVCDGEVTRYELRPDHFVIPTLEKTIA